MIASMADGPSISRTDLVIAAVLAAAGVVLMVMNVLYDDVQASALAVPAFLAVVVPVAWRRQAPLLVVLVAFAALLVHVALFEELIRCSVAFVLAMVLAFAVAANAALRDAVIGLVVLFAFVTVTAMTDTELNGTADAVPFAAFTAVVWGLGRFARSRSAIAGDLRTRTEELREAREAKARLEVATDRAQLAARLDALLERRLGQLTRLAESQPTDVQATTDTLAQIESQGRRTLEDMREIVGVLRHDDSAPTSPQPTLTHLEALVLRADGTGGRLTIEGRPRALPPAVELAAYRVVEHLLGALDDTPGVLVVVRFGDDTLELNVTGPARKRARGWAGSADRARERLRLHHGTLETSVADGQAHATALLPVAG